MRISSHYQIVVILLIFKINRIFGTGQIYTTSSKTHYYIDEEQKYTWFDAVGKCSKMNMTLVAIETEVKSQEINTLVKNTFKKSVNLWVGGVMTFNGDKRQYIWIQSGQPFSFTYWYLKNPDFYESAEYCIEIGHDDNMKWNDLNCKKKRGFICEYQQQQTKNHAEVQQINQKLQFNLPDMHSKWQDLPLQLKDQEKLKENIRMQEELNSQKELQLAKENEVKKLQLLTENLQAAIKEKHTLKRDVLQQEHELKQQLKNLKEIYLKKLKEFSATEVEVKQKLQQLEYEEKQQTSKITKQFRDFIFHLNQNTYYLTDAKITVNRNREILLDCADKDC